MPRGIPNKKRRGRAATVAAETNGVELAHDGEGTPIVGGELTEVEGPLTLGEAIESVRAALEPFDEALRRKVVRAASVMLK